MQEEKGVAAILLLLFTGALIALGNLLVSPEQVTPRLFIGRIILGSAASMVAGAVLVWIPGLSLTAILGIGSGLGIAGHQAIELWLKRKGSTLLTGKKPV